MEEIGMSNNESTNSNPGNQSTGTGKTGPALNNEEKSRQEGMKKGVVTTSVISLIILVVLSIVFFSLYKRDHNRQVSQMEAQKTTMTGQITARDSVINEWITTFDEIEKNISMIKEKEKLITLNSNDVELSKSKKEQILDDIKAINTLLEQNKKKIASLTAQLAKSGGTIKALQTKISELEASMKQSEEEISDLKTTLVSKKFEIEQLNVKVTDMQDSIINKDATISSQVNELNKAFYVCGSYKELKAKGLLTKEGGFIGLGKTEKVLGNFSDTTFTRIDISKTKSIPVNSRNAKLITEHPDGSYEFIRDKDKRIESIVIKDPAKFWKISKYAVVELTK